MKIARVFPTKTSMSPTDPLAFFGPPTIEAMAAEPEEVHISVTLSWGSCRLPCYTGVRTEKPTGSGGNSKGNGQTP